MKNMEPVHLKQDTTTGDYFLIYATDKGLRLDMRYAGETLWLSQAQIAELFGVDRSVITKHIANIYVDEELDKDATSAKFAQVRQEGERQVNRYIDFYNLDMIISVGYRVSSAQATLFRRWATGILVQFATKGFVIDAPRLKQPENFDRIKELRDIIRDIRADEANVYRELCSICAMCQDYNGSEQQSRAFFQRTQAKLIYAVVSRTPSEIVYERADSRADNMGLQTWPQDNIRKADVGIAKNYLTAAEIKELNRLTTILLDIFEDQLDMRRLIVMQDAADLLEKQLASLNRAILRQGGAVSADSARKKAQMEYDQFNRRRVAERRREADANIARLAQEIKALPKRPQ